MFHAATTLKGTGQEGGGTIFGEQETHIRENRKTRPNKRNSEGGWGSRDSPTGRERKNQTDAKIDAKKALE